MGKQKQPCKDVLYSPLMKGTWPKIHELLLDEHFTHGLNFEPIHPRDRTLKLYSTRIKRGPRLLLVKIIIADQPYWVMLVELLGHEYDRSPFVIEKGYLRQFLLENAQYLINQTLNKTAVMALPNDSPEPDPIEMHYFNNQLVALNEVQRSFLEGHGQRIVTGPPGSGKSILGNTMLAKNGGVYITPTPQLRDHMKNMWLQSPDYDPEHPNTIQFKTWIELVQELTPETCTLKEAGLKEFIAWLPLYWKKKPLLKHELTGLLAHGMNLECSLYQECRVILEKKSYRKIGGKDSLFSNTHLLSDTARTLVRDDIHQITVDYPDYLDSIRAIDYSFFKIKTTGICENVVVDEAQDFSLIQLAGAAGLVKNKDVSFFLDSNQSKDYLSKVRLLQELLNINSCMQLHYSFRCSQSVTRAANLLLKIRTFLEKGALTKDSLTQIECAEETPEGETKWISSPTPEDKEEIMRMIQSTNCAIVTREKYLKKAINTFPGAIVLTIEQAKGQEFDNIIAFELFDETYRQLDSLLNEFHDKAKANQGRAKNGEARHDYGPTLGDPFVAFTRAREKLIVYNTLHHYILNIKAILNLPEGKPLISSKDVASSKESWFKEARFQMRLGNTNVARKICFDHLEYKTEDDFQGFVTSITPEKTEAQESKQSPPAANPAPATREHSPSRDEERKVPMGLLQAQIRPTRTAQDYVNAVIKNTEKLAENLDVIFAKNTLKWLFQVPANDGRPLFSHIAENHEHSNRLYKLYAHITTKNLDNMISYKVRPITLLHCMIISEQGCEILFNLIKGTAPGASLGPYSLSNPSWFIPFGYSVSLLLRQISIIEGEEIPPFYWLCKNGNKILAEFLFKGLGLKISYEDLTHTVKNGKLQNTSALFWLTRDEFSLSLLCNIFERKYHPPLPRFDDLIRIASIHDESPLSNLAQTERGCEVLMDFLLKGQSIPQMHVSHLCQKAGFTKLIDGSWFTDCVWFRLSTLEVGRIAILRIFQSNQKVAADFPVEFLTKCFGKEQHSSLSLLATHDQGHEALLLWQKNQEMVPLITARDLSVRVNLKGVILSSFALLSMTESGCQFILNLIRNTNKIIKELAEEQIYENITATTTVLWQLVQYSFGRDILRLLLHFKNKILEKLTLEHLIYSLPPKKDFENNSVLYYLAVSRSWSLLNVFLQNPEIASSITEEMLKRPVVFPGGKTTVYDLLSQNASSRKVLYLITKHWQPRPTLGDNKSILQDCSFTLFPSKESTDPSCVLKNASRSTTPTQGF